MDTSNRRPTQGGSGAGGDSTMESCDWRAQLQADSRQRIVNKIMDTLKRHLPFSGHEGLEELKKIAVRFEEKIYTAATSQSDYLRKISLEMLTMETKSQNPMPNAMQSNSGANSVTPSDPGFAHTTVAPMRGSGILGNRPQQSYAAASIAPSFGYTPIDIEQAMHTMSLNPPDDAWYMDTGATSHMTSSQGPTDGDSNHSM